MKNILIINGHPNLNSLSNEICTEYKNEAILHGSNVELINLALLGFDGNLHWGYSKIMELEPDLIRAQESIKRADHIVIVFPTWWGTYPALLKGFFDRIILPGFAFKYEKDKLIPRKLLKGKTAHIITTCGAPSLLYRTILGAPGVNNIKNGIFGFCGIKTKKVTVIGSAENMTKLRKEKILAKIKKIAKRKS